MSADRSDQALSYLFVPASRPERFGKAAASGAHRIILDLEDAVAPAEKDVAREAVIDWFRSGGRGVIRINGADTHWFDADLAAVAACSGAEVMVPKAEPKAISRVAHYLVDRQIIALVETVAGLVQIAETAATKGVTRLAFGNVDFSTDARIPASNPALDHARFQIAMAARYAGLPPPIDGVTLALDDEAAIGADIETARNFGFGAKLCIHPRQVGIVNAGFMPSESEIVWAKRVLAASEQSGDGAFQLDGKMIDRPVLDRARFLLDRVLVPSP
jgi:citrate lyase subunit beta/citryl-CoA lyase